ncbi:MAG: Fic family protein [Mycoplasmataceae bacterium]|nr:Fic family protein [Mycoplasmataceae bacterium]
MKEFKNKLFINDELNSTSDLYFKLKADFTYHSSAIENSTVTKDDNFDVINFPSKTNTETIATKYKGKYKHDEIIENFNCGNMFEYILQTINKPINEKELKIWHSILKKGTEWTSKYTNSVGDYKKIPNSIGNDIKTPQPWEINNLMKKLLSKKTKTFDDIVEFHAKFESIHPFLDGNGRIGRGIMFKQCLQNNLTPIIVNNESKKFYYDGLKHYQLNGKIDLLKDFFKEQQEYFEKEYKKYLNSDVL